MRPFSWKLMTTKHNNQQRLHVLLAYIWHKIVFFQFSVLINILFNAVLCYKYKKNCYMIKYAILLLCSYSCFTANVGLKDNSAGIPLLFTLFDSVYVPCAVSLDEIHCWCDPGDADRLFNNPPFTTKPFSFGKDRQCEPIPWCISWVIFWYVWALDLCIIMSDINTQYVNIQCPPAPMWIRLWWLSSLFLSCFTGTRPLQWSLPEFDLLLTRQLPVQRFFFLHLEYCYSSA